MADVVAKQVVDPTPVPDREQNGKAEDKEEADPVGETAKKKKRKKKKKKSATTGETRWTSFLLTS